MLPQRPLPAQGNEQAGLRRNYGGIAGRYQAGIRTNIGTLAKSEKPRRK